MQQRTERPGEKRFAQPSVPDGKFRTAEVGSTSTPARLPRSETSASANPRHKPWSSAALSSNNSGKYRDRRPLHPVATIFPTVGEPRVSCRIGDWIFRIDHANRTDESVSLADHRLKKPWPVGVVSQRSAKLSHDVVDVLFSVDEQIGAPQPLHDLFAGHHLLAAFEQKDQQFHRLLLELDPPPGSSQFVATQVELRPRLCSVLNAPWRTLGPALSNKNQQLATI